MALCNSPTAQASKIQEGRDKMLLGVCSFGDKGRECGQMEAPRTPLAETPRPHHRSPSMPCSFLPFLLHLLFTRAGICLPESQQGPRASSGYLSLDLATSSPDSDLTLASVLSGVDRIIFLLWELRAQDSPHTRVEEGQAPLGLSRAATCQIWSDHRGLQVQP